VQAGDKKSQTGECAVSIDPPKDFPALLRWLRQRAGLSQNRLAGASGIDPAYVNRIEAAAASRALVPRGPILERLSHALELTTAERDRLYVAGGRCPPTLAALGGWDPALAMVSELLALPDLSSDDRAEFRQVLAVLVDRWRRSAAATD
jgi:transcriptional regulator with XRE-family HTH domain